MKNLLKKENLIMAGAIVAGFVVVRQLRKKESTSSIAGYRKLTSMSVPSRGGFGERHSNACGCGA